MRWNFGGNLQPVRMICEYDWKECPIAVISYIWSEIVTDVLDSVTGDGQVWRILAIMLTCSMLLHTIYNKTRWLNRRDNDLAREHLVKVDFKMKDLELKINILTYKMQYGTWPLPHEIPTPSLNDLKSVKLTLSNTSRQNMWTKHNLHGYISKCIQKSEDNKSMTKLMSASEDMDLACRNFLSQFGNRNGDIDKRNIKLFDKGNNCKDYKKLVRTAEECKKYMDEINESNKSLGLLDNSSDISDENSVKEISAGTESEQNSCRFLIDPRKWHEIYKYKNMESEETSESDLATFNQMFTATSKEKNKSFKFLADDERHALRNSDRSRLLPPGLSITFLSDKFKTLAKSDGNVLGEETKQDKKNEISTNEVLNQVKEKLGSLHDIKQVVKSSKSSSNICGSHENKKSQEIELSIKTNSRINSSNRSCKLDKKELSNIKKLDKLISSECNSSSGDNRATLDLKPVKVAVEKIPGGYSELYNDRKIQESINQNIEYKLKSSKNSFGNILKAKTTPDSDLYCENKGNTNLDNVKSRVRNPWKKSSGLNKNFAPFPLKLYSNRFGVESLSSENDSSDSFALNSNCRREKILSSEKLLNLNKNEGKLLNENITRMIEDDVRTTEDITNLYIPNKGENVSKSYVSSLIEKQVSETPMETDEDANIISQASSQTELSKDSDTDDKSTTTLLREALEFKKELLMQIQKENVMCEEKNARNESSDCESDETSRSKTDNHFRSKLLDIISEEQSAGSSTEKTSRTYILSRAINETNLCEDRDKNLSKTSNVDDIIIDKVLPDVNECCGDIKGEVTASSSEYFSTNNITDNEHISAQIINQYVTNGDGFRELEKEKLFHGEELEGELEFCVLKNHESNNIIQGLDVKLKKYNASKENEYFEKDLSFVGEKISQDIVEMQTEIPYLNLTKSLLGNMDTVNGVEKLETLVKNVEKLDKIEALEKETCENSTEKIEEKVNSVADINETRSEAKIKFFRSLSSIDSEKGISWNSISESSSNESLKNFVNALAELESKSIDTIAEQNLTTLNSKDYGERNFAPVGEDSTYNFISKNTKLQPCAVSLSEINGSERKNSVVEEILEMIADSAIFKLEKLEKNKDENTGKKLDGTSSFNSHSILNLDQERLQRKQDLFSKLKTLDAFTKPFDISECNSEKNENDGDASPLTGRTVVCICNDNTKDVTELKDAETKSETCKIDECDKISNISISKIELEEEKSEQRFFEKNKNAESSSEIAIEKPQSDCEIVKISQSKKELSNTKISQLSKSSITNFSTDTSESYFDVSNHDFAVSSIILTSQNSNFLSNCKDDQTRSETSSSYVDASDYCSKISNDKISTKGKMTSNHSDLRMVKVNSDDREKTRTTDTEVTIKDSEGLKNFDSKIESLTKTELMPKYTSSLPSRDKKSEFNEKGKTVRKDHVCVQSSSSFSEDTSKRLSRNLNTEKSSSKIRAKSRSCIPVLKSRIDTPRREKSMEIKARSQSPVRRSNMPAIQSTESNCQVRTRAVSSNENEKKMRKSINGSKKSLNKKQSYTLSSKIIESKEKCLNAKSESKEKKDSKIIQSVSIDKDNPEGKLTKECTVIYINIISDSDRKEPRTIDANEIIKYVNENDLLPNEKKLDPKCDSLSLRNIKSDESSKKECEFKVASPTSDSKMCKNLTKDVNNEMEKSAIVTIASEESENEKYSVNTKNRIFKPIEIMGTKSNKLLSTSTLELSNTTKVDKREIEVWVKPSVKNTSTSISDFSDTPSHPPPPLIGKRSFYNPKNEVFDVPKDLNKEKDQILLSEMLTNDQNFYECKKTHRLYNKLGLGFQEQTEQL